MIELSPEQIAWEERIAANPDDRALYLAYADWLRSIGKPAGEWIALHCDEAIDEEKLAEEQKRLLDAPGGGDIKASTLDMVLGSSAYGIRANWQYGCVKEIICADGSAMFVSRADTIELILMSATGRFVQTIRWAAWESGSANKLVDLFRRYTPKALHTVLVRDATEDETFSYAPLVELLPHLQILQVEARQLGVAKISSSILKRFKICTSLTPDDLRALGESRLPALAFMQIDFLGAVTLDDEYASAMKPIFSGEVAPEVTEFAVSNVDGVDALLPLLVESKIAGQITYLALFHAGLSDDGARTLAQQKARFPRLEALNLNFNGLTEETLDVLREAFGEVLDADQQVVPEQEDDD